MDISKFDYFLPRELIANKPANPRDSSRLLVVNRESKKISHFKFSELPSLLNKNDVLVFNKSKVFPARIYGKKKTKGNVEVLILRFLPESVCEVITKPGLFMYDRIFFDDMEAQVIKRENYITHLKFDLDDIDLLHKIGIIGHTPIPPYIKSSLSERDLRDKYQTVYAKTVGSAAAPTAGLHFTKDLMKKLKRKGIRMEFLTLHVGLGTFAPVKEKNILDHKIHEEYFEVEPETIKRLNDAKKSGKRIIAVGTTTTRVLETLSLKNNSLSAKYTKPYTELFIYPPYKFKFVDAKITNFHLPKSTLLLLISAFVSQPNTEDVFSDFESSIIGNAYEKAIQKRYRFFSFGDACFIE
ncbi:MAG TPA: tRNA preQ1(34) S-adenosylmethionine ribosyltransferase-isomerase QueA [Patescibacteria group bacterium]|nr:tRNA preQ1(34) S-adenosylmethionine ribosyltransferase-isomerase QueA [Patescibacteria group bacterium]